MSVRIAKVSVCVFGAAVLPLHFTAPAYAQSGGNTSSVFDYTMVNCPKMAQAQFTLPPAQTELLERCRAVVRASGEQLDKALGQITAGELPAQDAALRGAALPQTAAISARLSGMSRFSSDNLQFSVGVDGARTISTSWGILSPHARERALFATADWQRTVKMFYIYDPFVGGADHPDTVHTTTATNRTRLQLAAGALAQLHNGPALKFDARTLAGKRNVTQYSSTAGSGSFSRYSGWRTEPGFPELVALEITLAA